MHRFEGGAGVAVARPLFVQRTYGTLRRVNRGDSLYWQLDAEPQVRIRFKSVFPSCTRISADCMEVSNTIQVCKDLEWFLQRYPMHLSSADSRHLAEGAREFEGRQHQLEAILLPEYRPGQVRGLTKPLREYQLRSVEMWRRGQRYLLADDVGLGKSASAFGAFADAPYMLPALVVCQTHLPKQWKAMVEEFAPHLRVHIIKSRACYNLPPADVYVTSYSKISGWEPVFAKRFFKSVVFDECQELRCFGSDKYYAAASVSRNAEWACGLSATPIYNYGNEIWNIMNVLKEGCLGDVDEFNREWGEPYSYGPNKKIKDPKALGSYLRENYLLLRRTRKEVGRELPPVNKVVYPIEYNEELVEKAEADLAKIAARVLTGSFTDRGMAARELDMQARMMTGVAKSHGVAAYVRMMLENGESVLLAGWHRDVYDIWLKDLADFNPVMYTGSESPTQKENAKNAFMSGQTKLMFISLRSGVGLDGLQKACSLLVFGELDWSPGVHEQVIGRLQRDGQNDTVTALFLVADGGTDPLMVDILGLKASQSEGVMNPDEKEVTEITSDDERIKKLARQILERRGKGRSGSGADVRPHLPAGSSEQGSRGVPSGVPRPAFLPG